MCDLNVSLKVTREDVSSLYFKESLYTLENDNFKISDLRSYNERYWYMYSLAEYINTFLNIINIKQKKYDCLFYFEAIKGEDDD